MQKLFDEKKLTTLKEQIFAMLSKWAEEEGSGATNEEIIYILEGVKMSEALKDVFPEKA